MQNSRRRQVTIHNRAEPLPRMAIALASTPKRRQPHTGHLPLERPQGREVSRYSMIVEVPLHHRPQPRPIFDHPLMPALAEFLLDCLQFAPQPLLRGLPPNREPVALLGLPATVRESQKIEGLGLSFSSPLPVIFREAPILDQSRLLRV